MDETPAQTNGLGLDSNGMPMRPPPPTPDPRVYYHKARLLVELGRLCPHIVPHIPHDSTFGFHSAITRDGVKMNAMRIGHIWLEEQPIEPLVVVDKNAYYSDAPDLVPYSETGLSRRTIIDDHGFRGSGMFEDFNDEQEGARRNIVMSNPYVIALIQFMFILGNKRRYFWYDGPDDEPPGVHLEKLVVALDMATLSKREPHHAKSKPRPPPALPNGAVLNTQHPSAIQPQQMTRPRLMMPPHQMISPHQMMPPYQMVPQPHMFDAPQAMQQPPPAPYQAGMQPNMVTWQEHRVVRQQMQLQMMHQDMQAQIDPRLAQRTFSMPGAGTPISCNSSPYTLPHGNNTPSPHNYTETEPPKKRGRPRKILPLVSSINTNVGTAAAEIVTPDSSATVATESPSPVPNSAGTGGSDAT